LKFRRLKTMTRTQNEMNADGELEEESSEDDELTEEVHELQVETLSSLRASVKATQVTFKVNFYINVVIVVLGVVLIVIAIAQSILKGIDPFSVTFGGIGVASFVAVFLLNPQSRLHENLCILSRTSIVLLSFLYEYDRFLASIKETLTDKELKAVNEESERIVSFALQSLKESSAPQEKQTKSS
jgi:ABC-type multidrug transport system fused ATPase/permease subunit